MLYVRIAKGAHRKLHRMLKHRGHPHSLASIAAEMIGLGIDTVVMGLGPRTAVEEGLARPIKDKDKEPA